MLSGTGTATIRVSRNFIVNNGHSIQTENGALLIEANQQTTPTADFFSGVNMNGGTNGGAIRVTGSGALTVKGRSGNNTGGNQYGVRMADNTIIRGGTGPVEVEGIAIGNAANAGFDGVWLSASAQITSIGGNVLVKGTGGSQGAGNNAGVRVIGGAFITAGGAGTVTVEGTGGSAGTNNFGVSVEGTGSLITAASGAVTVTGTGTNGAADINMQTGGAITSTSTTTGILLNSTTNGINPNTAGTDVSTTATQKTTLGTGSKLNIDIDGTTVNTQYRQLAVVGIIDLNSATLTFTGSTHTPTAGQTFIIVDNDGTDVIEGTFAGLVEGALVTTAPFNNRWARISYIGGTGNDVVLTVLEPDYSITTTGN
ncbi:MAG: hypothetical protein EAY75_01010, partial [Bacteroidetes bacterium]